MQLSLKPKTPSLGENIRKRESGICEIWKCEECLSGSVKRNVLNF